MWEIIGLLLLVLFVVIGIAFLGDWLADFDGFYSNKPTGKQRKKYSYKNEKARSVYTAAGKSLKLNIMQMDSLRQMEEAARKHQE